MKTAEEIRAAREATRGQCHWSKDRLLSRDHGRVLHLISVKA